MPDLSPAERALAARERALAINAPGTLPTPRYTASFSAPPITHTPHDGRAKSHCTRCGRPGHNRRSRICPEMESG